jgi:formate dehydrogenase subunit delta
MKIENLVGMANQIGDFFKSFPDQVQAKKDIAQHLERFWASSMRDQILAYVNEENGEGLEPIVREAIKEYITSIHKQ